MTAQDWIKQRREREQAATPGPWEADLDKHGETRGIWPTTPDEEIVIGSYVAADGYDSVGWAGGTDENLRFIADARTALPKALDALEAVLAEHRPVTYSFSWTEGVQMNEVCPTCHDKAGMHECGCWREGDEDDHQCAVCSMPEVKGGKVAWPCKTYNAIQTALGVAS